MRHVTCTVCGHDYDPAAAAACVACPLRKGCPLVCCPSCGHVTVDTAQSSLVQLATSLVGRAKRSARSKDTTLADLPAGAAATVHGFCAGIAASRREQLEAYGLSAGRGVVVVRSGPVTVVRVDHTELALEAELATAVLVQTGHPAPAAGPA